MREIVMVNERVLGGRLRKAGERCLLDGALANIAINYGDGVTPDEWDRRQAAMDDEPEPDVQPGRRAASKIIGKRG